MFFLWTVDPDQARAYFAREAELAEDYLTGLQAVADTTDWTATPDWLRFGRIALEQGMRVTQANLDWARWAVEAVDDVDRPLEPPARRATSATT